MPVELPDLKGREEILKVHAKKVALAPGIDFNTVAGWPPALPAQSWPTSSTKPLCGLSGEAARRDAGDLEESIEVVIAGYQKKNAILTDKEKCIVAYHEVGHALVAAPSEPLRSPSRRSPLSPAPRVRWVIPCRSKRATTTS